MKFYRMIILFAAAAIAAFPACSSLQDNEGSTTTTADGAQITNEMMIGKWDLDGERTNTANGNAGVGAIPDDVIKDVFGKGWKFEAGGVLRTDEVVGSTPGKWRIDGKNTLVVSESSANGAETRYEVAFRDGFMYLKGQDGKFSVMEKSKFFGF